MKPADRRLEPFNDFRSQETDAYPRARLAGGPVDAVLAAPGGVDRAGTGVARALGDKAWSRPGPMTRGGVAGAEQGLEPLTHVQGELRREAGRGSRGGDRRLQPSRGDDWSIMLFQVLSHEASAVLPTLGGSRGPWLPPACRQGRGSEILHSTKTSKPPAAQAAPLHPCTPPYLSQRGDQDPGMDKDKPQRSASGSQTQRLTAFRAGSDLTPGPSPTGGLLPGKQSQNPGPSELSVPRFPNLGSRSKDASPGELLWDRRVRACTSLSSRYDEDSSRRGGWHRSATSDPPLSRWDECPEQLSLQHAEEVMRAAAREPRAPGGAGAPQRQEMAPGGLPKGSAQPLLSHRCVPGRCPFPAQAAARR